MERKTMPIYAYNMTLTESEFLKREFNLILTEIDEKIENKFKTEPLFPIATCDPREIEEILIKCRNNSALVFFFGNETYDVPQIAWLNKYANKIRFAYIYNFPRKTSFLISLRCLFGSIYDGGFKYWEKDRNIGRNFKNGIDLMRRTRRIKPTFEFSDFPQGYSKRFVRELTTEKYFTGDGSLIEVAPIRHNYEKKGISFTGQSGSWCRTLAISVLKKFDPNFSPVYTKGWGGSNQGNNNTYVKGLASSKFALNPPGNLTNRTHRYLESLIMNSLPIMPPATLQDPHLWGVWSEYEAVKRFSWKKQLKYSSKLKENQRQDLILMALKFEKNKMDAINGHLDKMFLDIG
jgi:hypothetical protein